jgi:hypothetical protein
MLKKSASSVLETREAYLVKRRSFQDSFGRLTFYVSPFTNNKAGLFEHPSGMYSSCPRRAGYGSSAVQK